MQEAGTLGAVKVLVSLIGQSDAQTGPQGTFCGIWQVVVWLASP
jgi:hypothetical protein